MSDVIHRRSCRQTFCPIVSGSVTRNEVFGGLCLTVVGVVADSLNGRTASD